MSELIIGVDIGYGNTKTAHCCMGSGVSKLASKPPINTRVGLSSKVCKFFFTPLSAA